MPSKPKKTPLQRFGKLSSPVEDDKDLEIPHGSEYVVGRLSLDFDDVHHAATKAFARALVKVWNEADRKDQEISDLQALVTDLREKLSRVPHTTGDGYTGGPHI